MKRMLRPPASLDLRKHPRALLRLPVRIRWSGPLGMRLEVTHTIDTSKEGLLVRRAEPCELFRHVWVAFPYDMQAGAQPETPARVLRVERDSGGSFRVALKLASRRRGPVPAVERRKEPRLYFALPVFARPFGAPWPEESMTQDISRSGARFETAHNYQPGDDVLAKISWVEWAGRREIHGRVLRIQAAKDESGDFLWGAVFPPGDSPTSVAVRWTTRNKS
jgi:PilZ domain